MQDWHSPVSRLADTDGNPAPLFAGASGLLFAATLLARTAQVPHVTLRRVNADGSAQQVQVAGPLRQVHVWQMQPDEPPERPQPPAGHNQARLVWLPEGFCLTPRSRAAPHGRGLPVRPDGSYTPGGKLTQVLLNTKQGNQYPHALHVAADGRRFRRRLTESAPLFHMPWERVRVHAHDMERGIGTKLSGGAWAAQFDDKGVPQWQEPDAPGGQWFCHRPQVARETAFQKHARRLTNQVRQQAGRPPLGAPLLGWGGSLGPATIYAIAASSVFGHDSYRFPRGYEAYDWRIRYRMGFADPGGENLMMSARAHASDRQRAQDYVQGWVNSPEHYANMVSDWTRGGAYAWVEHAWADGIQVSQRQLPPYGLGAPVVPVVPARKVSVGTQHFFSTDMWLYAGAVGRRMEADSRVGVSERAMTCGGFIYPLLHGRDDEIANGGQRPGLVAVYHRGRYVPVQKDAGDERMVEVLGAVIRRTALDGDLLRVAVLERQRVASASERPDAFVVLYEGKLHDFLATRRRFGEYALPRDVGVMSAVRFAEDGRAVFSYSVPQVHLWRAQRGWEYFPDRTWPGLQDEQAPTYEDYVAQYDDHQLSRDEYYAKFHGGGKMHFRCWRDVTQAWEEPIAPQGLEVSGLYTDEIGGGRRVWEMQETCRGEYALQADFHGGALVYLKVRVDAHISQRWCLHDEKNSDGSWRGENVMDKRLFGELVFADGSTLVYQDVSTHWGGSKGEGASGFVLQLGHVDVVHGQDSAYVRLDLRGGRLVNADASVWVRGRRVAQRPVYRQSLQWLRDNGHVSSGGQTPWDKAADALQLQYGPLMAPWAMVRSFYPDRPSAVVFEGLYTGRKEPYRSLRPRPVMPVLTSRAWRNQKESRGYEWDIVPHDALAPVFMQLNDSGWPFMQMEFHKGHWMCAGWLAGAGPWWGGWWPRDECDFHASSLPLASLVGEALEADIAPFGVV